MGKWVSVVTGLMLTQACQLFFGAARIDELAIGASKPSNVAAFVSVTRKGKPVSGLPASSFALTENGQRINADTSKLQLIEPARYAAFHAVLLIDLSQSTQPAARQVLAKAAAAFVRRSRLGQSVTVVAYDGSSKVQIIGEFPLDPHATAPEQVDALVSLTPADPSRNLRGAVAQGLEILNRRLDASNGAVKLGTLAVFTRGPDLAGRFADNDLEAALKGNTNRLVLIDVTGDKQDSTGERVSEAGVVHAETSDTLPIAFEEAATLVDGLRDQYYLISYCSPSRAGQRKLEVTVSVPDTEGKDDTDTFTTSFDATGFTADCDPQRVPTLVLKTPLARPASAGAPAAAPEPPAPPAAAEPPPQDTPAVNTKAPPVAAPKKKSTPTRSTVHHGEEDEAPVPAKPGYE
jgi:hypothetical protein